MKKSNRGFAGTIFAFLIVSLFFSSDVLAVEDNLKIYCSQIGKSGSFIKAFDKDIKKIKVKKKHKKEFSDDMDAFRKTIQSNSADPRRVCGNPRSLKYYDKEFNKYTSDFNNEKDKKKRRELTDMLDSLHNSLFSYMDGMYQMGEYGGELVQKIKKLESKWENKEKMNKKPYNKLKTALDSIDKGIKDMKKNVDQNVEACRKLRDQIRLMIGAFEEKIKAMP